MDRSSISDDPIALRRTSDLPTEFARSCSGPTLSRGSVRAYEVPPSAMKTAIVAITFA